MSWNDTPCSYKAVLLTGPMVRFLATEDLLTSSLATHVLLAVLQGLQIHGQHETNQVNFDTIRIQKCKFSQSSFQSKRKFDFKHSRKYYIEKNVSFQIQLSTENFMISIETLSSE